MVKKHSFWNYQKIRELRKHLGLSQSAMACELGTRQQTISDWEIGLYEPRGTSVKLLNIIAERASFYGISDEEK